MGRYAVDTSERADRDIDAASMWWSVHRPAAPRLLRDELRRAMRLAGALPRCGLLLVPGVQEIRRLLLRRTGYRLEYRIDSDEHVTILRLVHQRRRGA